jgi:hypothetical protein
VWPAPRPLCHIVVACWMADVITGPASGGLRFPEISRRVADLLDWHERGSGESLLSSAAVNSTTKLLVDILLSANGSRVKGLRTFLDETVAILGRAELVTDDASLLDKRMLLSAAGLLPSPSPMSSEALWAALQELRLSAAQSVVEKIAFHLECVTLWGTQPISSQFSMSLLHDFLSGLAVDAMRRYDLRSAARLLRLTEYVAPAPARIRRADLHEFLLGQQAASGAFGRFGPEAADLRRRWPRANPELEMNLPATVEWLWTMAEAYVPGWRLYGCVPRYLGSPLSDSSAGRQGRVSVS